MQNKNCPKTWANSTVSALLSTHEILDLLLRRNEVWTQRGGRITDISTRAASTSLGIHETVTESISLRSTHVTLVIIILQSSLSQFYVLTSQILHMNDLANMRCARACFLFSSNIEKLLNPVSIKSSAMDEKGSFGKLFSRAYQNSWA